MRAESPLDAIPETIGLLRRQWGGLDGEQIGSAVTYLSAKVPPRSQHAQHPSITFAFAGHDALLCVAAAATRHQLAMYSR